MNRRQLFGWLSALPFVPAALAASEPLEVSGGEYARTPITFPAPTADWGKPIHFSIFNGDEISMNDESDWPLEPPDFIDMKYQPKLPQWF